MTTAWIRACGRRIGRCLVAIPLVVLCACAGRAGPSGLSLVSLDSRAVSPVMLQHDVRGEWCFSQDLLSASLRPPWQVRMADTGRAVAEALAGVAGANVLVDVTVRTRIENYLLFQRVCSVVVGDAGRIE